MYCGQTGPLAGGIETSQLGMPQREVPVAPCHLGAGALEDLRELGRFYRAYRTLMSHWRSVLPPAVRAATARARRRTRRWRHEPSARDRPLRGSQCRGKAAPCERRTTDHGTARMNPDRFYGFSAFVRALFLSGPIARGAVQGGVGTTDRSAARAWRNRHCRARSHSEGRRNGDRRCR